MDGGFPPDKFYAPELEGCAVPRAGALAVWSSLAMVLHTDT